VRDSGFLLDPACTASAFQPSRMLPRGLESDEVPVERLAVQVFLFHPHSCGWQCAWILWHALPCIDKTVVIFLRQVIVCRTFPGGLRSGWGLVVLLVMQVENGVVLWRPFDSYVPLPLGPPGRRHGLVIALAGLRFPAAMFLHSTCTGQPTSSSPSKTICFGMLLVSTSRSAPSFSC
jgi:hypothetical protein